MVQQAAQARRHLEQGLIDLALYHTNAAWWVEAALLRAHLAIALARCGQPDAAVRQLRRAEKILRARGEQELLLKVEKELAASPAS